MTRQFNIKKDNEVRDLVDDIMDQDNSFKDTFKADHEDIFIDDNLFKDFHQNDKKNVRVVCDDILKDKNLNQNNVLFEELPKRPLKQEMIRRNKKLDLAANKIKKTVDHNNNTNISDLKDNNSIDTTNLKKTSKAAKILQLEQLLENIEK